MNNFGFNRKSGILMPISALPSSFGIGNFGKSAYKFVDFISECKQKCWQVLPLNPTSYGDSPYQSPASIAGNPYFIDPETLYKKRLITKNELKGATYHTPVIDYGRLFSERYDLLRLAYSRFAPDKSYAAFLKKEASWIDDYALFMSLKIKNSHAPWTSWSECEKDYSKAKHASSSNNSECGFWKWIQYEFFSEWSALLEYAHSKKISIIGDMPIYVAHDSMDVWRSPEQFLLDEDYNPKEVAGCPPDAYSADGQLWGNPIYNWELMKEDSFSWWKARVAAAFKLYDILRIDHFRGFASYYSIPYGDTNAKRGKWVSAPGKELFDAIRAAYPKAKIIAEDLGYITDDVRELLSYTGFPGMKLLQFAFFEDSNEYLPKNYTTSNCVVYTGSHDSECTKSWAKNLSGDMKMRFLRETGKRKDESRTEALIRLAMQSSGNLVIIPIQDYLELPNEKGRINTPSTDRGNWTYRLSKNYNSDKLKEKIIRLSNESKRATRT